MKIGLKRYFTGVACPRNHTAERYIRGQCVECSLERKADWHSRNKDKVRAYQATNHDAILAQRRKQYLTDVDTHRARKRDDYHSHVEIRKAQSKRWREANPDRVKMALKAWREVNADHIRAYNRKNSVSINATSKARRARVMEALPGWLTPDDFAAMRKIYIDAAEISRATGIPHHVDHEIPLQGKLVCGLHMPSNLRIITASLNHSKGNRYQP